MSSINCSRCSMPVTIQSNGTGVCGTCKSWRCPSCTSFELARNTSCTTCQSAHPDAQQAYQLHLSLHEQNHQPVQNKFYQQPPPPPSNNTNATFSSSTSGSGNLVQQQDKHVLQQFCTSCQVNPPQAPSSLCATCIQISQYDSHHYNQQQQQQQPSQNQAGAGTQPCMWRGCTNLVQSGFCSLHLPQQQPQQSQQPQTQQHLCAWRGCQLMISDPNNQFCVQHAASSASAASAAHSTTPSSPSSPTAPQSFTFNYQPTPQPTPQQNYQLNILPNQVLPNSNNNNNNNNNNQQGGGGGEVNAVPCAGAARDPPCQCDSWNPQEPGAFCCKTCRSGATCQMRVHIYHPSNQQHNHTNFNNDPYPGAVRCKNSVHGCCCYSFDQNSNSTCSRHCTPGSVCTTLKHPPPGVQPPLNATSSGGHLQAPQQNVNNNNNNNKPPVSPAHYTPPTIDPNAQGFSHNQTNPFNNNQPVTGHLPAVSPVYPQHAQQISALQPSFGKPSWESDVESIRESCRQQKTIWKDKGWCKDQNLRWGATMGPNATLRPKRVAQHDSRAPHGFAALADAFRGGGGGNQKQEWQIVPPASEGGVKAWQVLQAQLGDCYLISTISCLAHSRPDLIEALFPIREVNQEGVFVVRLWLAGRFKNILLDSYFPVDGSGFFKFARCRDGVSLWVQLLEKALAHHYGSYKALDAGNTTEAFYDLTGMPSRTFNVDDQHQNHVEGGSNDDFFSILVSHNAQHCVMAASCGGENNRDQNAKKLGLVTHHAYSLLDVAVCQQTQRKMVFLRNPHGSTKYNESPPSQLAHIKNKDTAVFWLDYHNFVACFHSVSICMTRPFTIRLQSLPAVCNPRVPALQDQPQSQHHQQNDPTSFYPFPSNFGAGCIMFEVKNHSTEVFCMICQNATRETAQGTQNQGYFDVGGFLLRLPDPPGVQRQKKPFQPTDHSGQPLPHVVMVCGARINRCSWWNTFVDPGVYLLVPFSFQQQFAKDPQCVSCVLSEAADCIVPLSADDPHLAYYVIGSSARWFYNWVIHNERVKKSPGRPWDAFTLRLGEGTLTVMESRAKYDTSLHVDATHNKNMYLCGRENFAGQKYPLLLPANHAACIYAAIPLPYGGSGHSAFSYQYGCGYSMREQKGGGQHNNNNRYSQTLNIGPGNSFWTPLAAHFTKSSDLGEGFNEVPFFMRPIRIG